MGWRGHKCDIQVEGERPDDDSNLWTLVFGAHFMYILVYFMYIYVYYGLLCLC